MKKVLILGGGFAGVQAAIELQKSGLFRVTLVTDRDFLYLYPVSIWIPVRKTEPEEVRVPLSAIQKKFPFEVVVDTVKEVHASQKAVVGARATYPYDYLLLTLGADKMKHSGIEHTLSICGRPEVALAIRERLDALVAKGNGKIAVGFGGNPKDKSAVRGGPAFELMFNIHQLLREKKIRENFELTFFAPMEQPGERMGPNALPMLNRMFSRMGINKRFGKKITGFVPEGVHFEDGSMLASDLVLFIPASAGHAALASGDLPLSEAGFVKIDDYCEVEGFPGVYAAGDIAALEGPDFAAKQGHLAEIMARNAAYNLIEKEKGTGRKKGYSESISILCVMDTGHGAAMVYRGRKRSFIVPMPVIGHWMKKGWGHYARLTKTGRIPRIPGL